MTRACLFRAPLQLAAAVGLLVIASTALAAEVGIAVGTKAPEFTLHDQQGKVVKSAELRKKGPLAVVFHRSANW